MHAGGIIRRNQTCGSMVSGLTTDGAQHFFTGTAAPCLSIFKPASFDFERPHFVLNPDEKSIDGSLWQRHEYLHRRLLFDRKGREAVQAAIAPAEKKIISAPGLPEADRIARDWEEKWLLIYHNQPIQYPKFSAYGCFWKRENRKDGFDWYI